MNCSSLVLEMEVELFSLEEVINMGTKVYPGQK